MKFCNSHISIGPYEYSPGSSTALIICRNCLILWEWHTESTGCPFQSRILEYYGVHTIVEKKFDHFFFVYFIKLVSEKSNELWGIEK